MPRSPDALTAAVRDAGLPDRYDRMPNADRAHFEDALSAAIDRIDDNLDEFYDQFPTASSENLVYGTTDNTSGWTTSFWTGLCWLAYEVTGADRFREAAEIQLETFERRLENGNSVKTHDLGFLYSLSAVAGHRLTGNGTYRDLAVRAADLLTDRFWEAPGLIQAWSDPEDPELWPWAHGRMIIDTSMNLPLLFWASEATGERRYASIAATHARTNAEHIVREDGSTFHTFKCDVETGEPLGGETFQGYEDDSCWSRGQAWTIYGYAIAADYENEGAYAELSAKLANYYLQRVEDDHVPRWDFDAPDDHPLDTSAAAITASGLFELATVLPAADDRARRYRNAGLATLSSLVENYVADESSNGLLTDATYHYPDDNYDGCCIWGDYYYVEALVRATRHWERYW